MLRQHRFAACLSLALIAGCAATRPGPRLTPPEKLPSVADLENVLAQRRVALHGLRSMARLHYRDRNESGSAKQAIVVSRPDRLRIEVLSLLGTVFVMTADRQHLVAYARDEQTLYRGTPSRTLMGRYARVALAVNEVIDLLLASPPSAAPVASSAVDFDEELGAIRLTRAGVSGAQQLWFSPDLHPVAAEQRDREGDAEWYAEFAEYEVVQDLQVATKVALDLPRLQRRIEVELMDPEVNPPLADALFALQAPAGVRVVDLDEGVE